jgi:hypothetical protein
MLPEATWGKISKRRWPGAAADDKSAKINDAIDMVLVLGWKPGTPPPTAADKGRIKLLLVEHSSTQDLCTRDRRTEKRQRYVMLVAALQREGWTVVLHETADSVDDWYKPGEATKFFEDGERPENPVHTIIMGHAGFHTRASLDALAALGVASVKPLLVALSKKAVSYLHTSLSMHVRSSVRCGPSSPSSHSAAPTAPQAQSPQGVG